MTVRAALGGRAGPLGPGAALAGVAGLLACGRIELGSYTGREGATGSDMAGGAGRAGNGSISDGPIEAAPSVLIGEAGSAPLPDGAGGAPVGVFGASDGGSPAIGNVDSDRLGPPDAGSDAGLDGGRSSSVEPRRCRTRSFSLGLTTHARRAQDPAVRYHMVGFRCASREFL